jgi:hypothetical protein
MLNPATRIIIYFRRRLITNSTTNPKHMTAVSHKLMPPSLTSFAVLHC